MRKMSSALQDGTHLNSFGCVKTHISFVGSELCLRTSLENMQGLVLCLG